MLSTPGSRPVRRRLSSPKKKRDLRPDRKKVTMGEAFLYFSSYTKEETYDKNKPYRFDVALPKELQRGEWEIALASITLNPYFKKIPFYEGDSNLYPITYKDLEGNELQTVNVTYDFLFPSENLDKEHPHLETCYTLLSRLIETEPVAMGTVTKVETPRPRLDVVYARNGILSFPSSIQHLLGGRSTAYLRLRRKEYKYRAGQKDSIFIDEDQNFTGIPPAIHLMTNLVEPSFMGERRLPILREIPIHDIKKRAGDFVTYETGGGLQFHRLRPADHDRATFELRTPWGHYVHFKDAKTPVLLSCVIRPRPRRKNEK